MKMKLENATHTIELLIDEDYSKDSTDNFNEYAKVYFEESEFVFPTQIGVKTFENETPIASAIIGSIGGGTGVHENSQIIENDKIVVCCSDSLFCLTLPSLELLWKTEADQACCFEVFKYKEDYIVHGEMEISRINANGKIVWKQSGSDIFTTFEGKDVFTITDSFILATDWEHKKYKFDFDGNLIR
jgi:outer membrane protein assembly factor BamB